MTTGTIEQWIALAAVGWILAAVFFMAFVSFYRMWLAESKRGHEYSHKIVELQCQIEEILKNKHG